MICIVHEKISAFDAFRRVLIANEINISFLLNVRETCINIKYFHY